MHEWHEWISGNSCFVAISFFASWWRHQPGRQCVVQKYTIGTNLFVLIGELVAGIG